MGGNNELVVALETLSSRENAAPADVFKAFNKLIRANGQDIAENVPLVLDNFHPVTRIGRILRIRLVDRYRVHSEVLKLLQSGDSLDTNQALKCRWFFVRLDNPGNFVNQILPTLSYSMRLKVINKYSSYLEDTAAGEALYLGVKSRYGIRGASLVLPACSESFIRDELPNLNVVVLRPNLILALHKKYPSLAAEYVAYLVDAQSPHNRGRGYCRLSDDYRPVFHKLSQTDPPAFMNIFEKHWYYIPPMTVGRRTMKVFIKRHFNHILTNYVTCREFLAETGQFYKQLSYEELKAAYVSAFLPTTITEFFELTPWDAPVYVLKNHVKPNARGPLLQQVWQSKYSKDPFSSSYLPRFSDHWIELLPIECRPEKVESRLSGVVDPNEQAEFLAYLPVDQSIPRLKKLIEAQSDSAVRSFIASRMMKSLWLNENPKGLKELFAYFNKRFRNETKHFRQHLLSDLNNIDEKFLLLLDKDDWATINDLLAIILLNHEVLDCVGLITSLLKTQIHCYLLRNVEIEPHLQRYFDFQVASGCFDESDLTICQGTPYQRICVEWFLKKFSTIEWTTKSEKMSVISRLLLLVIEVNKRNEPPLVFPEELILEMEALVRDSELYDDSSFHNMLKQARRVTSLRDRLVKIAFPRYVEAADLSWCLKIYPELVRDELENVLAVVFNRSFREYRSFYSKCRLYESYGIPQKLARICRVSLRVENDENLEDGGEFFEKSSQPHAVQVLSLVLRPSEYVEVVSKYAPVQATIEDLSEEAVETFTLQKAICQSFVAVSTPSTLLPILKKFIVGDYLKIAVGALNSVCSRIPENQVLPVLKEWADSPISLRKHLLRLIYQVAPAKERMAAFVEFFKKEKNSSLRRVIFLEIRRTFLADPRNETFDAMSTIVHLLTVDDEVVKDLISEHVQSTSSDYVSRYLELIWSRITDLESVLPCGKTNLILYIDKHIIKSLDEKFCAELLSHSLNDLPGPLSKFVYLCILNAPSWDSQRARLKQVISALTPFIQNEWNKRQTGPGRIFIVHRTVSEFVHELCDKSRSCEDQQGACKVLNETKAFLTDLNELRSSLKLLYWLDAHILFLSVQNDPQVSFESALTGLYKTYVERYEPIMPHSLASILSTVVPMASSLKLAHELVQVSELPLCQILAAKIAETRISSDENLPFFHSLIENLSSSKHPDVQNAAAVFFEAIESSVII